MSEATVEVYQDRGGQWRWRLVHRNGNIIAEGGQGYASKRNALDGVESVRENLPDAAVEVHRTEEHDGT
ncbi:MAG: HVO_2922 family protein [Haloferacaceae archaeon]